MADERRTGVFASASERPHDGASNGVFAASRSRSRGGSREPRRRATRRSDRRRRRLGGDTLEEKVAIGPNIELTEVTVTFEGDPSILDDLIDRFSQKAMRAGG